MADIGIMGGTFDPIHNGHLMLGQQAYQEYHLDAVWFMPSGQPPHKLDHTVAPAKDRQAMVCLAIAAYPYFTCSDFEVSRAGNSYTAQTLALLQEAYPEHRFYFIIGADSLYEMEHWYHPEQVMARTTLLVAGRNYQRADRSIDEQIAYLTQTYQARIYRLHCEEVDISSQELRQMVSDGRRLDQLMPESVADYIYSHKLYRT